MEELFSKGWLEDIKHGRKVQLHETEAGEILFYVARTLELLTTTKSMNAYMETLPLDDDFKAAPSPDDFDTLSVQTIRDLEATKFTKSGKGEFSIRIEAQSTEEYYAELCFSHLLYAWQELGQKPVRGDVLKADCRYITDCDTQATCSGKVNLASVLDSISVSLRASGRLSMLREVARFLDEKSYSGLLVKVRKLKKSTTIAANIRWAGNSEKHDAAIGLIKTKFNQNKNPGWFHSDYVNWIFETYKDENGTNSFKTIKDDDGKTIYKGIGRGSFSKRVANMFRTDLNSPLLVRGDSRKPKTE